MQVLGTDRSGRPVVSKPSGLEKLDRKEILRLRYLGMLSGDPRSHFLGSDMERTFGEEDGPIPREEDAAVSVDWRARWERVNGRTKKPRCPVPVEGHHRTQESWRTAFHEIGRISSWLGLPNHIRDEIARIYTNLRNSGATISAGIRLEKQLARVTYLACLVHRLPKERKDLDRGIRELYGFGFGRAFPPEFIKALNTRRMRFYIRKEGKYQYLRQYEEVNGKPVNYTDLGKL